MTLVAFTAVTMGTYMTRVYGGRREYLLGRAESYASRRREYAERALEARRRAEAFLSVAAGVDGDAAEKNRKWADDELLRASLYRRVAEFDAGREARYRLAADRPWEKVPAEMSDPTRPGLE